MVMLTGLARVARDAGLTVREVPGWKTRTAHRGGMSDVRGILYHHTATSAAAVKSRNNPTVQYMTNGLGYPLANYGLAWDGSLDVIAAGTGAHAGKGNYAGIPKDRGNQHLIGIEVEGTIGLEWSPAQLETAARLGAALDAEWGGLIHIAHYEWAPGRKTDPTGIPGNMNALRNAIKRGSWGATIIPAAPATSTPKEDNLSAEEVRQINAHTTAAIDGLYDRLITAGGLSWAKVGHNGENLRQLLWEAAKGAQAGYVNTNAIKNTNAEVVKAVASVAQSQGLTPEQVSALIDATAKAASEGAEKGASEAVEAGVTVDITATTTANKKES